MEILVFYDLIKGNRSYLNSYPIAGLIALIGTSKPFHKKNILYCQSEVII